MMTPSLSAAIRSVLQTGPRVASTLYDELVGERYSRNQCKVALSRLVSSGAVHRYSLPLGHNDSIVALPPAAFISPGVARTLRELSFFGRPNVTNLVKSLCTTHPVISIGEAAKLLAARVGTVNSDGDPAWADTSAVIAGLVELGFLLSARTPSNEEVWCVNYTLLSNAGYAPRERNPNPAKFALQRAVNYKSIAIVNQWLSDNSIVSPDGGRCASAGLPIVGFGLRPFDYLGFSFVNGVARRTRRQPKPTPAVVVGDVVLSVCDLSYADSFIQRQRDSGRKRTPIGFIVAKGFERDAFSRLKGAGVLPWAIDQLLGRTTSKAIDTLLRVGESLVLQREIDPTLFVEAFEGFDNFKGMFGELKSQLFEVIVGHLFQKRGFNVKLAWEPMCGSERYDIDVLAVLNREAVVVECKAISPRGTVPAEEVRRHFDKRSPCAKQQLLGSPVEKVLSFKYLIVSTADFDDEGKAAMGSGRRGADTVLELWNRQRVMEELKKDGHTKLVDLVGRYFAT
jgi:hypothetical protein